MLNIDAHRITNCMSRVVDEAGNPFLTLAIITDHGQITLYPTTYHELDLLRQGIEQMEVAISDNPNLLRR